MGLPGLRVIDFVDRDPRLEVTVELPRSEQGCRTCAVIAGSHGRRTVRLVDAPRFGRPVQIVWRKRTCAVNDELFAIPVFNGVGVATSRPCSPPPRVEEAGEAGPLGRYWRRQIRT